MKLLVILFILKLYAEETFLLPHDFSPWHHQQNVIA